MHTFLTGSIQVGKSTIIRTLISHLNLSADGFMTYWEATGTVRSLFLSPYGQADTRYLLARDNGGRMRRSEDMTRVFDTSGAAILAESGRRDVIVMDELGFLESDAAEFGAAVMRHIDGAVPVLGVIKPIEVALLDAIRAHPNVAVYEVTVENRDEILAKLLMELKL